MYILFQFKNDGSSNKEFNLGLEHNTNVLAYLTTKIEEDSLLSDLPDLDNQLGLSTTNSDDSKESEKSENSSISENEESNDEITEESSSDDNKEDK